MALDVQYISLDVSKQPTPQQVRLGQGDANATQLVVSIFDEGVAYDLTSYDVRLRMRLPNGGGYYDVDGTKSANVATFDVDESYAASTCGFDGFGYVDILSGDTVICSTSRFQLVVLQSASDGVELSPQYSDAVQDAIDRAVAAAEAAEGVILDDVPTMTANIKGGAKLGSGLEMNDQTLSVDFSTVEGELSVSHGGTGASTAADARTALGVYSTSDVDTALAGKAAAVHTHAASAIVSGQLGIANGGTGASTAAGAKAAIVDGQALAPASVAATGAVSGSSISDSVGTLAQVRAALYPKGSYNTVVTFSSVKSGNYYHAIWQLPLGSNYASVSHAVVSQVGAGTSPISTSDVTSRLLSNYSVDLYTDKDVAAGKSFLVTLTLQ